MVNDKREPKSVTGKMLDKWASYFGLERADGEDDESLRKRLVAFLKPATTGRHSS